MNNQPHRRTDRVAAVAVAALLGVIGAGAAMWGGVLSIGAAAPGLVLGSASVVTVILWLSVRRAQALSRLEAEARQQLTTGLLLESPPQRIGDSSVPAELEGLRGTLDELGRRLGSQVKEVAKKTRNLEALIAAMDEPLLATDQDECVLLCNRSAEAVLQGETGEKGSGWLIGRRIDEVFTHSELLEMHAAARAGEVRRSRVPLVTPLGRRVFQVSALPVPVAWGEGVFGAVMVLRDVTELDQAVQVKTEFVANASHELRTPVATIRGAAETLQSALHDDPEMARKVSNMIVSHAARLEELLRDLLDLSRLESPDAAVAIGSVHLAELERSLRGLFDPDCRERRLTLVFDVDDDLTAPTVFGVIHTDPKLLMLILRNLIENAIKFAFEETEVRVAAQLIEQRFPRDSSAEGSRAGRPASSGVVRWEVTDKGMGIPLNQQERVFERFYQVDGARTGVTSKRGTGLGLAIVKHAVKTLGGRVGLRSVWGQGTTVWVELPVGLGGEESASQGIEKRAG